MCGREAGCCLYRQQICVRYKRRCMLRMDVRCAQCELGGEMLELRADCEGGVVQRGEG